MVGVPIEKGGTGPKEGPSPEQLALIKNSLSQSRSLDFVFTSRGLEYSNRSFPGAVFINYKPANGITFSPTSKVEIIDAGYDDYRGKVRALKHTLAGEVIKVYRERVVAPYKELVEVMGRTDFRVFALADWIATEFTGGVKGYSNILGDYAADGTRVDEREMNLSLIPPGEQGEEATLNIGSFRDIEMQDCISDSRMTKLFESIQMTQRDLGTKLECRGIAGVMLLVRLWNGRIVPDFLPKGSHETLLGNRPTSNI